MRPKARISVNLGHGVGLACVITAIGDRQSRRLFPSSVASSTEGGGPRGLLSGGLYAEFDQTRPCVKQILDQLNVLDSGRVNGPCRSVEQTLSNLEASRMDAVSQRGPVDEGIPDAHKREHENHEHVDETHADALAAEYDDEQDGPESTAGVPGPWDEIHSKATGCRLVGVSGAMLSLVVPPALGAPGETGDICGMSADGLGDFFLEVYTDRLETSSKSASVFSSP